MSMRDDIQDAFGVWMTETHPDLSLDELVFSTDGVPVNPYLDNDTRLLFDAYLAGTRWKEYAP